MTVTSTQEFPFICYTFWIENLTDIEKLAEILSIYTNQNNDVFKSENIVNLLLLFF
jgi:hypothetical protein